RAGVIAFVPGRYAHQTVTAHLETGPAGAGQCPLERRPGHVVGDTATQPLDLFGRRAPVTAGHPQPGRGDLQVPRGVREPHALMRLVRGLVLTEPHVA